MKCPLSSRGIYLVGPVIGVEQRLLRCCRPAGRAHSVGTQPAHPMEDCRRPGEARVLVVRRVLCFARAEPHLFLARGTIAVPGPISAASGSMSGGDARPRGSKSIGKDKGLMLHCPQTDSARVRKTALHRLSCSHNAAPCPTLTKEV